jgi:GTPase SAR1 family protein
MSLKMASRTECSVVVVGDARVGKTALIRRLTTEQFTEVGGV